MHFVVFFVVFAAPHLPAKGTQGIQRLTQRENLFQILKGDDVSPYFQLRYISTCFL